jgi:hypothetical protein
MEGREGEKGGGSKRGENQSGETAEVKWHAMM